jgi:hypothetical protein
MAVRTPSVDTADTAGTVETADTVEMADMADRVAPAPPNARSRSHPNTIRA